MSPARNTSDGPSSIDVPCPHEIAGHSFGKVSAIPLATRDSLAHRTYYRAELVRIREIRGSPIGASVESALRLRRENLPLTDEKSRVGMFGLFRLWEKVVWGTKEPVVQIRAVNKDLHSFDFGTRRFTWKDVERFGLTATGVEKALHELTAQTANEAISEVHPSRGYYRAELAQITELGRSDIAALAEGILREQLISLPLSEERSRVGIFGRFRYWEKVCWGAHGLHVQIRAVNPDLESFDFGNRKFQWKDVERFEITAAEIARSLEDFVSASNRQDS